MDEELSMPDGYDPELFEDLETDLTDRLEALGYKRVELEDGKAYRHPDTGHTIYLTESDVPQQQYKPGDDVEM